MAGVEIPVVLIQILNATHIVKVFSYVVSDQCHAGRVGPNCMKFFIACVHS